jgi:endonuclease G
MPKLSYLSGLLLLSLLTLQSCNLSRARISNSCPTHLPDGIPTGTRATNDFICRDIYALSSNDTTKFADWVAFRLDPSNLEDRGKTDRVWQADPDIDPAATLEPEDYKGAYEALGTDRGHLAPLASFKGKNWQQVNYLSNIVPQKSDLNRGDWNDLEEHVRDLVRQKGEVYVIVGTFYTPKQPYGTLPGADEPNVIPSGFWQIVMYDGVMETYLFPQDFPKNRSFRHAETNLQAIEMATGLGLDFLGDRHREIDF